jgi:hypothetical protein
MEPRDYHINISANISAKEAFDAINNVPAWWATHFTGIAQKLNDTFTVNFGDVSVDFKIIEFVPNQKVVWLVTDCNLTWLNNKKEWNGNTMVWEISTENNLTQINFTHVGLVPELECYNDCNEGWNFHIGKSLLKLMTEHKGMPDVMTVER